MGYLTLAREHTSSSGSLQMAPPAKTSRPGVTGVWKMHPISKLTTATRTGPSRYIFLEPNTLFSSQQGILGTKLEFLKY